MSWPTVSRPEKDAAPFKTINEMHRYRDAILYRKQKSAGENKGKLTHEIIGAYVLYPGRPDKAFDYKSFIREENIGAIPLLPGTAGTKALYEYLEAFLAYKGAEDHLGNSIPPRGTSVVVGDALGESIILVVEQPAESFLEKVRKYFVFPVEKTKVDVAKHYRQIKYVIPNQSVGLFNIDQSVPAKEMMGEGVPHFELAASKIYVVHALEAKKAQIAGVTPSPAV